MDILTLNGKAKMGKKPVRMRKLRKPVLSKNLMLKGLRLNKRMVRKGYPRMAKDYEVKTRQGRTQSQLPTMRNDCVSQLFRYGNDNYLN